MDKIARFEVTNPALSLLCRELSKAESFSALPADARKAILSQLSDRIGKRLPEINEDTMPGELANIIAGRIAALYDFKGPNFVADAACASAMAGITAAVEGLIEGDFDAVLTGGIDANMSPSTYVKFCKIGALSATGARPYAEGADGFVMGEGAVIFLLKRLVDAERDGDKIYSVIRGLGGSSDGKGKGITAPNPAGQKLCIRRAWENAGVAPSEGDLIEGHGTSTPVGDVAEVQSLVAVFAQFGLATGSVALGSVKSNIGHLKGAAGAAGILKAVLALHEKVLPPSLNFQRPNHDIGLHPYPAAGQYRATVLGRQEGRAADVRRPTPSVVSNSASSRERLQLIEEALKLGHGTLFALDTKGQLTVHSTERACPNCNRSFAQLDPKNFSYNSAQGWCPKCRGFGELFYLPDLERGADADSIEESWWSWAQEREVCPDCKGARVEFPGAGSATTDGHSRGATLG